MTKSDYRREHETQSYPRTTSPRHRLNKTSLNCREYIFLLRLPFLAAPASRVQIHPSAPLILSLSACLLRRCLLEPSTLIGSTDCQFLKYRQVHQRSNLSTSGSMAMDDPVVSARWLHQHLGEPDIKVLDASWYMPEEKRDPWQEYQVAHIPGALFFDIDGILDRTTDLPHMLPSQGAFAAAISALDIKNQDKVIIYDGKGFFSAPRVWWMFRVFGHNEVWVLDGGLLQWRASGFEIGSNSSDEAVLKSKAANNAVEAVYNSESAIYMTFQTKFQPQLLWTLEKVKHNVTAQDHQLVDARSKGRFDGVAPEPRKGVRSGHMPGAKSVPFPEMFDDAPMLLPADKLCKKFEQAGVSLDHPIVVSCGSGVTACILALGLYRIRKHDIPVYDGSWTEWEAQPDIDYPKVSSTS